MTRSQTGIKQAHRDCAEDILKDLMREANFNGYSDRDLENMVGRSWRTHQNYRNGDGKPSVEGFIGIIRVTKPVQTMKKLCRQANGYFIQLDGGTDCSASSIATRISDIMKETADVVSVAAESLRDGRVTDAEKKRLSREIDEAIEALLRAQICLDDGRDRYDE